MSARTTGRRGRVRIIGGRWRRRVLRFGAAADLRPTPDAARERLFAWLEPRLPGAVCLDLFAGSGALGFEAASRGAARVVMVERGRGPLADLRRHRAELGADAVEIIATDALHYLRAGHGPFDIIFLDPPWRSDLAGTVLELLAEDGTLAEGGLVCLEQDRHKPLDPGAGWRTVRTGRCGGGVLVLLERAATDGAPVEE